MPATNVLATPGVNSIAIATTIPTEVALTGTITTSGLEVTGIGTLFTSEIIMPAGQLGQAPSDISENWKILGSILRYKWLYDPAQNVVREIDYVRSDTNMVLKEAFPIDIAVAINLQCPDAEQIYRTISLLCPDAGSVVNGITIVAGSTLNWDNEAFINPIAVNGTVGAIQVLTKE